VELRHVLLALAVLGAAAGACSATGGRAASTGFGGATGSPGAGGSQGAPSSTGSLGAGGSQGVGGINLTGTGGNTNCPTRCSADLHSVVDCNGNVVTTCPPTEGCGAAGCVPACEAALENKSTIGCDYYAVDPDIISAAYGACFAAYVANTWNAPVSIGVSRAGQTLDATSFSYLPTGTGQGITLSPLPGGMLAPGLVAIVFLGGEPGAQVGPCPAGINVGVAGDAATHGTGIGDAFHITTSAPTVAYDIVPYGGGQSEATSATLLLPTTAWDTNYIAVDAFQQSQLVAIEGAVPFSEIVAAQDGTTVTISPTAAIVAAAGVAGTAAGTPMTYDLDQGQVLQFSQPAELIGSVVQANHPIGFWGGASCLNIPVDAAACDSSHQQIPPVKALGHEYVAVRYRNRFAGTPDEAPPWRLVGAVDGTVLTWDPAPPAGAPLSLALGQLAQFNAPGPFTVQSQDGSHPFYMSAHMTGCSVVNPAEDDCRGDPEFVNVIPPQQYLESYTFFTDPTYPETDLVLVRQKGAAGFQDVTLDCSGTVTGWTPVGAAGEYELTRVDLVTGDFVGQNGCDNGRHEMTSKAPFGLTVWGWGSAASGGEFGLPGAGGFYSQFVSYAYPAGASVQPINTVVIPPMPM
jgi:hypothetical protein